MILIADSGSTKTDWALVDASSAKTDTSSPVMFTQGINPFHQSRQSILQVLRDELLPQLDGASVSSVKFYGSGVRPEMKPVMASMLREVFPQAETVEAHSDLLGAARALCGCKEGIACILGTGANSCLYDGQCVVQNTPALGYILGDEGSGAVLGKRFLHDLYGGLLSKEILLSFETETGLSLSEIISHVYRQPLANRFLASLSVFIHHHLSDPTVRAVVIRNFEDFLRHHVRPYDRQDLPVSFVGSIAWHYQSELREASSSLGFSLGSVLQSPLPGLVSYHLS